MVVAVGACSAEGASRQASTLPPVVALADASPPAVEHEGVPLLLAEVFSFVLLLLLALLLVLPLLGRVGSLAGTPSCRGIAASLPLAGRALLLREPQRRRCNQLTGPKLGIPYGCGEHGVPRPCLGVPVLGLLMEDPSQALHVLGPEPALRPVYQPPGLVAKLGDIAADVLRVGIQALGVGHLQEEQQSPQDLPSLHPGMVGGWARLLPFGPFPCGHVELVGSEGLLPEEPQAVRTKQAEVCVRRRP